MRPLLSPDPGNRLKMNAPLAPFTAARGGLYPPVSPRQGAGNPYRDDFGINSMPIPISSYIRRRQPPGSDPYLNAALAARPSPWVRDPAVSPLSSGSHTHMVVPPRRLSVPVASPHAVRSPYPDDHGHHLIPPGYECGLCFPSHAPTKHSHSHHHYDHSCCSSSSKSNDKNWDSSSSSSKNKNNSDDFDFKTKDISIRNKVFAVRASYLSEAPKFEADLNKYLGNKKEELLPTRILQMLISFINRESYHNTSPLDEVTLNILSHNVGSKSVVESSLSRLKKMEEVGSGELAEMVAAVLCSDKVAEGLKEWLRKYLSDREREERLVRSRTWAGLCFDHPEVEARLQVLLGLRRKEEEGEWRII